MLSLPRTQVYPWSVKEDTTSSATQPKKKYLKKLRLEQKGRLLWEAGKLISIDLDNIMAVLESIKYIKKANGLFFLKPISSCKKHKISNN